jgi:ribosomal 50S subunit-recycling heat shock protein
MMALWIRCESTNGCGQRACSRRAVRRPGPFVGGRVHVNGERVKPSKVIRTGDTIEVTGGTVRRTLVVTGLTDRRGPASDVRCMRRRPSHYLPENGTPPNVGFPVRSEPTSAHAQQSGRGVDSMHCAGANGAHAEHRATLTVGLQCPPPRTTKPPRLRGFSLMGGTGLEPVPPTSDTDGQVWPGSPQPARFLAFRRVSAGHAWTSRTPRSQRHVDGTWTATVPFGHLTLRYRASLKRGWVPSGGVRGTAAFR